MGALLHAQTPFEGKIYAEYTKLGADKVEYEYWLSPVATGVKMIFQLQGKPASLFFTLDRKADSLLIVGTNHLGEQAVHKMPKASLTSTLAAFPPFINFTKDEKPTKIMDYDCETYHVRWEMQMIHTQLAPLTTYTEELMLYLRDEPVLKFMDEQELGGFPLQTLIQDLEGKTLATWKVTLIEPYKFTEDDFRF